MGPGHRRAPAPSAGLTGAAVPALRRSAVPSWPPEGAAAPLSRPGPRRPRAASPRRACCPGGGLLPSSVLRGLLLLGRLVLGLGRNRQLLVVSRGGVPRLGLRAGRRGRLALRRGGGRGGVAAAGWRTWAVPRPGPPPVWPPPAGGRGLRGLLPGCGGLGLRHRGHALGHDLLRRGALGSALGGTPRPFAQALDIARLREVEGGEHCQPHDGTDAGVRADVLENLHRRSVNSRRGGGRVGRPGLSRLACVRGGSGPPYHAKISAGPGQSGVPPRDRRSARARWTAPPPRSRERRRRRCRPAPRSARTRPRPSPCRAAAGPRRRSSRPAWAAGARPG